MVEEITRRKSLGKFVTQGDEALRNKVPDDPSGAGEELFRRIVESIHDGVIITDLEGRISYWNPAAEEIFAYSAREALGRELYMIIPERYHQSYRTYLRRLIRNTAVIPQNGKYVSEAVRKGGREFPVEFSASLIHIGNIPHMLVAIRDITERRRVEASMLESELQYRIILESTGDMIHVIDRDFRIILFNNNLRKTFEAAGLTAEVKGRDLFEVFPFLTDDIREQYRQIFESGKMIVSGETTKVGEIELITETRKIPVYSDGSVSRVVTVIRDITRDREAERALRESEARFKALVDNAPFGISVMRPDNTFEYLNPKFTEIFGYRGRDLPDKDTWFSRAYPNVDYRREVSSAWRKDLLDGRDFREEGPRAYRVRCKDGGEKTIQFRTVILGDGRQLTSYEDISARAEAEESLKWELAVNTALVRLSNTLILAPYDLGKIAGFILDFAKEITGSEHGFVSSLDPVTGENISHTLTDMMGDQCRVKDPRLTFPAGPDGKYPGLWGRALNTGTSFFTNDPKGHPGSSGLPEGHIPIHRFLAVPAKIGTELVGLIALANPGRDYTAKDLKAVEQLSELYILAIQRQRSREERVSLEAQLQQAQKMEAVGTLAGGIAHDFNNLLMGIQGRTSLMMADYDLPGPHMEHLRGIEEYVRNAAHLTKQLLGFARGGKYEVKPTDLNAILQNGSRVFGRTRKEITIHEKYQEGIWTVEADQGQIDQLLLNLYVNAWHAMPAGGSLYLETSNLILEGNRAGPLGLAPGRYVKISVTDTGFGMDESTRRRIFDPFFTTKEMGRGAGLGLASAYGIVKNHGGMINVFSKKGEGTTFNIYLPASESKIEERPEPGPAPSKGTGTVLLVDDEEMILEVGLQILEKLGFKVLQARSGMEALEIYGKDPAAIDIVILDMIMPEMSGGKTYDGLKEIDPSVKVLLSSGYSLDGQAAEIIKRGCHGFIQKPFTMKELSRSVSEVLKKDRANM